MELLYLEVFKWGYEIVLVMNVFILCKEFIEIDNLRDVFLIILNLNLIFFKILFIVGYKICF